MALGIYKPGQGYWVRVMTAALIGVVTLAAAGWIVRQMQLVADKLPRTVWAMTLQNGLSPAPTEGQPVMLYAKAGGDALGAELGSASVFSYDAGSKELRINNVKMNAEATDPGYASDGAVKIAEGARMKVAGPLLGRASVQPELLEGLAAALVLLIGAGLAYWAAAMHQGFVDFLIATDGEMKKVNWSTARDIRMSTMVVIFAAFVLSLSLFVVDLSFQWIFTKAGILVH